MPEWYLVIALLALVGFGGLLWTPLLFAWPLFVLALAARFAEAGISAARLPIMWKWAGLERVRRWFITAFLHLSQPLARLIGRLRHGLTPWRWRASVQAKLPRRISTAHWSEIWREPERWVRHARAAISREGPRVIDGGPYDRWDIEVPGGLLGKARLLIAVEEQGAGTQYIRFGIWPRCSGAGLAIIALLASLAGAAAASAGWTAAAVFAGLAALVIARIAQEASRALAVIERAVNRIVKPSGLPST